MRAVFRHGVHRTPFRFGAFDSTGRHGSPEKVHAKAKKIKKKQPLALNERSRSSASVSAKSCRNDISFSCLVAPPPLPPAAVAS